MLRITVYLSTAVSMETEVGSVARSKGSLKVHFGPHSEFIRHSATANWQGSVKYGHVGIPCFKHVLPGLMSAFLLHSHI